MCDSHLNLPVEETEEARGGVWGGAKTGLDGSCGGETLPPGTEAVPTGGWPESELALGHLSLRAG